MILRFAPYWWRMSKPVFQGAQLHRLVLCDLYGIKCLETWAPWSTWVSSSRKEERKKRACRKSGERRGEEGEKMKENFRRQVIFFFVITKVRYNIARSLLLKDCFSFFFIHIFLQNWLTHEFLFCSSVCIRMNVRVLNSSLTPPGLANVNASACSSVWMSPCARWVESKQRSSIWRVAEFWNICRCYLVFLAYHMLCMVPKQN